MPKRQNGFTMFIASVAALLLSGYAIFSIVSSNIKISQYEQQMAELDAQTESIQDSNDQIRRYLEEGADLDEYIEDMARDRLGYAKPDERIYYVVPDSDS